MHPTIARVTERIETRSQDRRSQYLERMRAAGDAGPRRAHLTCGNQAHAYAAMGDDKTALAKSRGFRRKASWSSARRKVKGVSLVLHGTQTPPHAIW